MISEFHVHVFYSNARYGVETVNTSSEEHGDSEMPFEIVHRILRAQNVDIE